VALEKAITPEGLRIYVDTIPTAQTANIHAFVGTGSVHETDEQAGLSHALEHCTHVTEMFPTRQDLRDFDGENSILSNANTSYNRTLYFGMGPFVDPIMKRMGEVLFRATYPSDFIANEVNNIQREAKQYLDDIDNVHMNATYYGAFGKPYGREILGYSSRLDFTPEQLRNYYKHNYVQANMAIVAVGNVRMQDIINGVEQYFEPSDSVAPHVDLPQPKSLGVQTTGLLRKDSENARLSVSSPMDQNFVHRYLDNQVAYETATEVIRAQSLESLRLDAGIAYQAAAFIRTWNDPNAWMILGDVTTGSDTIDQARSILADVMSKPANNYADKKISSAIGRMRSYYLRHMDSIDGRVDMHIGKLERSTEPTDLNEFAKNALDLTHQDVRTALDNIVNCIGKNPSITHITGPDQAVKNADVMIDQSTIV
jgi:predicted Zn-dependent peptidase